MEFDVGGNLDATRRSVSSLERDGRPARAVMLSRIFATTADDLWNALTDAERLPLWFLPVHGDLAPGGRYQLEGHAGGTIETCEPPSRLALTWEFGGDVSWVGVDVADDGEGGARLTLTHTSILSEHWKTYGPGAAGVGWEMALAGLAMHLARPDASKPDGAAWVASPEGRAFISGGSDAWGRAAAAAGTDPAEARAAAGRTTAFYTGEA